MIVVVGAGWLGATIDEILRKARKRKKRKTSVFARKPQRTF
jgi:hypothetical protein